MDKVFSNKKLAYALIGILLALQLTQSIANWVGGGFNGGSLILCILMLGLLTLVGVGISKKNKLLTIVSGTSILSVVIYVLASELSGIIQTWIDGKISGVAFTGDIFASIATLLLIGCFVLAILKAFKVNRNLKVINTVFSVIAFVFFLVAALIPLCIGFISEPQFDVYLKIHRIASSFFATFIALLIPCVWHQIEEIKNN